MMRVQIGRATLYCGDALEVLPELSGMDAVLTDPPYSSGGAFRGDRMGDAQTKYLSTRTLPSFSGDNRDQRAFHFWSALWSSAALRACKVGAVVCVFSDWRQLPVSTDYLQAGGWIWRGIVPWVKTSYRPQLGRFGAQCEYVVWGSAGPMRLDRGVRALSGFYEYASPMQREHVTQKPLGLMADLLNIAPPGGRVLDAFMGSGTTGVAVVQSKREFFGIELDAHAFDVACRRIDDAQNSLFDERVRLVDDSADDLNER
ncbi:site-specific DNA-methyltransferase (adenine-specific) [Paraburkholderia sp. CI2]|uniref:DNA-methyltransferase n=1 Tax=Paraburkholderia sp. CI2 TaxID=2723093 RepID=UPI00181A0496|nr:DNA methyltransferase [Paraburkholderia sp. CI2]MBB5469193.1 site-specific DNA-methyltransferase (adenine-specific) [Paraburkholderia sp. CI2]